MDTGALLKLLETQVNEVERFQQLINKAKTQSAKFSPAVVEKVVRDNMAKSREVAEKLAPVTEQAGEAIANLRGKRDGVIVGSQEAKFSLQEIELRHVIGEYDEEAFAELSADPKAVVEQADAQIADLEAQAESLENALVRWLEIGGAAGLI